MTLNNPTKLIVLDVDDTTLHPEGLDTISLGCNREVYDKIVALTTRAMNGEMTFEESLDERVGYLQGYDYKKAIDYAASIIAPSPGAVKLLTTLSEAGWAIGLCSGGFYDIIDIIVEKYNLPVDFIMAQSFITAIFDDPTKDDKGRIQRFTGGFQKPIVDGTKKLEMIQQWASDLGISQENTVAIGDGNNDIEMTTWAGLGIGFNPKKTLAEKVDACVYDDLSGALEFIKI
ncbi:MAG: HAD-IB family phosphatase [Bifidobacteriaceae bacterium]|jgi:phosphoserine phosphatase|nr:HAD-IB family phosphatase [Bifidobacteriaceae bacterium]